MSAKIFPHALAGVFFGLLLAGPLAAQNRLYIEGSDDKFHAVFKVSEGRPYIMDNGQLTAAKGQRFALKKVEEYLPVLITIHDLDARSANYHSADTDAHTNNQFHFSAGFESTDRLEDVFIALELEIANVGKRIFVYEIGQLDPRTPKPLKVDVPIGEYMGAGGLTIHLFVGGAEVFTSEQTAAYRDEMLSRMIAKRVAAAPQSAPKPFYGSAPDYPAALRQSGLKGEAVVTLLVTPQGTVQDPVVARASEPAFGEEALAAVRQWRFVPQVQDGHPVEKKVSIPFVFDPPAASKG